jgi:superfamily II DNA or RNA helicase
MKILNITKTNRATDEIVYDLEIDENHNYFVEDVLVSNCHKIKSSNLITKNITKIKTPHKFGFTGTLPKTKIDEWKIIGTFGPVIYEKSSKELRDEKYLTEAAIKVIKLNHSRPPKLNYKKELTFLYNNENRNNLIQKIVNKLAKNSLILVNHLEQGEVLYELLSSPTKEVYFVSGAMPVELRNDIIKKMEEQDNIICIAMASIFSTGINIKNLHYILFVAGGKSFIRTVQAIGRGLRLHKSKEKLVLIDFYDNMKYSTEHSIERKIFYDEEQISWNESEINL